MATDIFKKALDPNNDLRHKKIVARMLNVLIKVLPSLMTTTLIFTKNAGSEYRRAKSQRALVCLVGSDRGR